MQPWYRGFAWLPPSHDTVCPLIFSYEVLVIVAECPLDMIVLRTQRHFFLSDKNVLGTVPRIHLVEKLIRIWPKIENIPTLFLKLYFVWLPKNDYINSWTYNSKMQMISYEMIFSLCFLAGIRKNNFFWISIKKKA